MPDPPFQLVISRLFFGGFRKWPKPATVMVKSLLKQLYKYLLGIYYQVFYVVNFATLAHQPVYVSF
jgi:hypothetical protein